MSLVFGEIQQHRLRPLRGRDDLGRSLLMAVTPPGSVQRLAFEQNVKEVAPMLREQLC